MCGAGTPRRSGQTWATFLRNHGHDIWAADFLPVTDLLFRPLHAFFVIEVVTRRMPGWRSNCARPPSLGRRHVRAGFAHLASSGIEEVRTANRAPRENAICERFLGRCVTG